MLIATAYAAETTAPVQSALMGWLPILLIFAVFYFFVLRPQTQRAKEHQEMVSGLAKGDQVLTTGGFYGEVIKVIDENKVLLNLADGVEVEFASQSVASVIEKGKAAKKGKAIKKAAKKTSKKK